MVRISINDERINSDKDLISNYFRNYFEPTKAIEVRGNGVQKAVYKVVYGEKDVIVAVASPNELGTSLVAEYHKLHDTFDLVPHLVPKPIAHYRDESEVKDIMVMEYLPHLDIDDFLRENPSRRRELAYMIGNGITEFQHRTSRFLSEPHDGNILAIMNEEGKVEIKFCDASQFTGGSLEEGLRYVLGGKELRDESRRFIIDFREGIFDSAQDLGIRTSDFESRITKLLSEYNPIF